ncbi:MAG: GNAT family N-acetyltransferase [Ardenticatenaceae bacterium]
MLTIRPIRADDVPALAQLLGQLGYRISLKELAERVDLICSGRESTLLVATNHESIVGCVQAMIDRRLAEGTYGEVVSLVVDQAQRGQGIGRKLVEGADAWVINKGYNRMRVRSNVMRNKAHQFFEKLGFSEIKSQKIFTKSLDEI